MTSTPASNAHPFAHLGPAPYRYVGLSTTDDRAALNAHRQSEGLTYTTNLSGGSCDHCGVCISDVYYFRAADGTKFKVGSTCYEKGLDSESSFADAKALAMAGQAKREAATRKRHTREATLLDDAVKFFQANQKALDDAPHPLFSGSSLNDYLTWTWKHAGTSGKIKAYRVARRALAA